MGLFPPDPPSDLQHEAHVQNVNDTIASGDAPRSGAVDSTAVDPPSASIVENLSEAVACADTRTETQKTLVEEPAQIETDSSVCESVPAPTAGLLAPSAAASQSQLDDAATATDKVLGAQVAESSQDPSADENVRSAFPASSAGAVIPAEAAAESQVGTPVTAAASSPGAVSESQPTATRSTENASKEADPEVF